MHLSLRTSCSLFSIATYAVGVLQFVPGATFSALRAYVLSRSKLLALLVAALSLVQVGANLVHYGYQFSGENFPPFGCLDSDDVTAALDMRFRIVVIVSRITLIVADMLLIYTTWTKLSKWGTPMDIRQSKRLSLSDVLFRGGTIYFVCLFILNVLHLVFSCTALAGTSSAPGASDVTEFTAPITTLLISRFLLALQEANQMVVRIDSDDPRHSSRNPYDSTPTFISSLGGFINPELSARSDDDSFELQACSRSEAGEEEGDAQSEVGGLELRRNHPI
ncbi:hypothetical protein C8T65DRAFT_17825 [Cerioporus squamosus]|nr:hypothetical protein C8T65DRAFT_17825 [Cerioporus squamosus]